VDAELSQARGSRLKDSACGTKRLTKQAARRIKHGVEIVGSRKGLQAVLWLCCPITRLGNLTDLDVADPLRTTRFPNLSRMRTRRGLAFSDSFSLLGGDSQCELRVSRLRGLDPTQPCHGQRLRFVFIIVHGRELCTESIS
jgi:hypothetical protein